MKKGKLALPAPRKQLIQESLKHGLELLSIQNQHIDALDELADHHADPFDRMLIAQAKSEQMTLLSVRGQLEMHVINSASFSEAEDWGMTGGDQ